MSDFLQDIGPFGLGIALSPVPVLVVLLMLGTQRARANSIAYLIGFAAGLAVLCVLGVLLAHHQRERAPRTTSELISWGRLALGVLLLGLGCWRWRAPVPAEPKPPAWMTAVEHLRPVQALGLGAFNSGVSVKNLVLIASAAAVIGQRRLSPVRVTAETALFLLVGMVGVVSPVLFYLVQGAHAERTLRGWKVWLLSHNARIMAVALILFGILLIGKGLKQL
jgi:hypothetical protein